MKPKHIIESQYLKEGLFGQIFSWCLEILPYLEKHNLKPQWRILSRNYGTSPAYNIFPDILRLNYKPEMYIGESKVIKLEQLKFTIGHPVYNYHYDFTLANYLFNKYFQLPGEVIDTVEKFLSPYAKKRILGLHYRGHDKVFDTSETNPVTDELLLQAARDFLEQKGAVDLVFLASDEESFIDKATKYLPVPTISFTHQRVANKSLRSLLGINNRKPFHGHKKKYNTQIGREAIIDSLLLSRCCCLLKCQSALSGWSKVWNPNLEVYRIAAFKHDWFTEAFIPLYKTKNDELMSKLLTVQEGEFSMKNKLTISLPVSTYLQG